MTGRFRTLLFTAASFTSAFLLFSVQPFIARLILPKLGGSSSVWNTCMVFFQATLLAGYFYAHRLTRRAPAKAQLTIHLALGIVPLFFLPMALPAGWRPPVDVNPVLAVLMLLAVTAGPAFFVVSTSAPLLQKWYARGEGRDPYFLYAASNAGSFLALLSYPFVIETRFTLADQSRLWAAGYLVFLVFIAVCVAVSLRGTSSAPAAAPSASGSKKAYWFILSFLPASLMMGLSVHITTDIASVPLLWIVPLALYLLTFILAFSSGNKNWLVQFLKAAPHLAVLVTFLIVLKKTDPIWISLAGHLLAFFTLALILHARLSDERPSEAGLTEFYLWLSLGGVAAGVFNALLAPVLFKLPVEYHLAVVLGAYFALADEPWKKPDRWDILPPVGIGILAVFLAAGSEIIPHWVPALAAGLLCLTYRIPRPLRFALSLAAFLIAGLFFNIATEKIIAIERSYFGVSMVRETKGETARRILVHGTTVHGAQWLDPAKRTEPLNYYHPTGPAGDFFKWKAPVRAGFIGLGSGALATYAKPGDDWTFYEIDPEVKKIAENPAYFTFLSDARKRANIPVVLGDGRMSLAQAPDRSFDVIVVDAFSSDSVPVHLLSREAMELYLSKLKPEGAILFHISNRYLKIERVLGAAAKDLNLDIWGEYHIPPAETPWVAGSQWAALSSQPIEGLADAGWKRLEARAGFRVWTDDFSNLLSVL